ncbi:deaminase domain-containing protein [Pseudomonas fluorescens]|uniref:deaminase domain-containing protein n=1 Tax=Pseudomonas fluorescens TaxID=294 RepID=UPI001242170B|nr:deaminase domain-containing protein [Pseudomonas fluorescens]
MSHQDVEDLEKALKECKDNCDAVRAEFAKRDADNTARLNNCWATGDCEKIKAEIDEGSRELNKLWQNDKTGITDQFLHSNIADSTNARTRASLDHLPKGDPANAVKLLAAAGIIALAPEAIGLLGQYATRGAATCAANPVLCVNEAGVVIADLGLSEALPVGLGAAAGGLTTKELTDLRVLMEIEAKTGAKLTADEVLAVVRPAATGAIEAAAVNELARLSERAVQVRSQLNIGSGRNIAVAEYSIDGRSAELVGVSGLAKRPGKVDVPEKQVFDTIQTGNNPRTMDSEYKILSNLADKLTPSSQGVVNIYSELPICVSCSGVISQFQQRFPGVIVNVETGKPR